MVAKAAAKTVAKQQQRNINVLSIIFVFFRSNKLTQIYSEKIDIGFLN